MLLAYNPYQCKSEDSQLWTALRSGERSALEELFKRYHVVLYNYGIKITSDRDIVRETVQQLFFNLWKRHLYLSDALSVKAYLLASLRRLILEHVKRNKARNHRNQIYLEEYQYNGAFTVEELLIRKESQEEKTEIIQKVLNHLTPRQKEAVFLRFYHGLTNKEIVDVMNINEQCVRNLIYDSIRRLRRSVEQYSLQD